MLEFVTSQKGTRKLVVQGYLFNQLELGTTTGKKKKEYVRINEALHTMVVHYNNQDPVTYLGEIARVLNINVV